ncbi:MAG: IS1634 family transposase [Ignavibacteria bacterium]|nr:IS1634 family transposase [Ignavibacteria bacterium]
MFIRKKKNPSGVISIQVIDKSNGKYKVIKTIGSSSNPQEINYLFNKGKQWIKNYIGQTELNFNNSNNATLELLDNIEQISNAGTELLLGNIFDQIGFNKIEDVLFRKLVISRLCFPASKLKTTDMLSKYHFSDIDVHKVYRYMDKLYDTQKELVQQISYDHTLKVLNNEMQIIFYDVTTLYFEIDNEDDLRKTGFSKEGKHQNPQILLGLLVSIDGYPLAYEIFEGNKYEGHTMLPVIETFRQKYKLEKLVIVADSGLISKKNIEDLQSKGYDYIIGSRIKIESKIIKEKVLSLRLQNGQSVIITKEKDDKLIISYSEKRASKDKYNREKGLLRLKKQISQGNLTKSALNKRGYNKFLKLEGKVQISLDESKIKQDAQWDGLKGYLTNTVLTKEEIINNYNQLWKIEKAFRISKTDLKIRPIYHRLRRRIEAHICIAFVAYKIYKELERQLKEKKSNLSPEQAIEIAKTIYKIQVVTKTGEILTKTLFLKDEQKNLAKLFNM